MLPEPAPTPSKPEAGPAPSVWRNRDFVLFFSGQLVSNVGTWLQNVAQSVLVLELTGRSLMVGVTTAALFLPVLLLAPIGGRLADRFDRRRLLIVALVVATAATGTLAILVATGHASVLTISIVALLVGLQAAVFIPAMGALLPGLVRQRQLGEAIGLNSVTYNAARAVGPLLATVAITTLGYALAFGLNTLSYLVLIVALLLIRSPRGAPAGEGDGRVREAFAFARSNRRVGLMLLGVLVVSMAADPVLTLAPAFAREYGRPASDAGILIATFGLGAIAAAVILAPAFRASSGRRLRLLPVWVVVYAAGLAGLAGAPSMAWSLPALAVAGVGFLMTNTTLTTGVLDETPDRLRGRIMGLWTVCFLGSRPVAALIDGSLADWFGPGPTALVMAFPLLTVALLTWRSVRSRPTA